MTQFRTVLLTSVLLLLLCGAAAQAQSTSKPLLTLQMPALPDPVRVTLNPATTAMLVLDYVEPICNSQPKCKSQMLPAMTPFMERARKAGLVVAYGTREPNMSKWLPEVAPAPGDIKILKALYCEQLRCSDIMNEMEGAACEAKQLRDGWIRRRPPCGLGIASAPVDGDASAPAF